MSDSILRSIPFVLFVFSCLALHAKTLTIPGDADSIQEAVELAASGDEIVVATSEYHWVTNKGGVPIYKKNLTITGSFPEQTYSLFDSEGVGSVNDATHPSQYSLLWIEDSHVTLKNLNLTKPFRRISWNDSGYPDYSYAPIQARSGSLTILDSTVANPIYVSTNFLIKNSRFIGNTFISNHPAGYGDRSSSEAAFRVHSATAIQVRIENCSMGQPSPESYKQMELLGLKACEISIKDSTVQSGYFDGGRHYRMSGQYVPGAPGIHIHDCTDLSLNLHGSEIQGGKGSREIDRSHIAAPGGEGVKIEGSSVIIRQGLIRGGEGGRGSTRPEPDPNGVYPYYVYHSGKGGTGLMLLRSNVQYEDLILQGGPGGTSVIFDWVTIPSGPEGEALLIDEFSTFQEVTAIPEWSLF